MPWAKDLQKKARKGFRGYPIGTLAFYGPDDRRATKTVVGVVEAEDRSASVLQKWFSERLDARVDPEVGRGVDEFLRRFRVSSVVITRGIIGCPHEEDVDYPAGGVCPECPFWAAHDRWQNA